MSQSTPNSLTISLLNVFSSHENSSSLIGRSNTRLVCIIVAVDWHNRITLWQYIVLGALFMMFHCIPGALPFIYENIYERDRATYSAPGAWFITKVRFSPAQYSLTVQHRGLKHQSFIYVICVYVYIYNMCLYITYDGANFIEYSYQSFYWLWNQM